MSDLGPVASQWPEYLREFSESSESNNRQNMYFLFKSHLKKSMYEFKDVFLL